MKTIIKIFKLISDDIGIDIGDSVIHLYKEDLFEYNGTRVSKIIQNKNKNEIIISSNTNFVQLNKWAPITDIYGHIENVTEQIIRERKINIILE